MTDDIDIYQTDIGPIALMVSEDGVDWYDEETFVRWASMFILDAKKAGTTAGARISPATAERIKAWKAGEHPWADHD